MIQPLFLKPGDHVAIAAPARKISQQELAPAVKLLQSWGLEVVIPEHLFDEENQFAGSDDTRAALMQHLLDAPDIRAIFCARGGYGTVRIIDRLDFSNFAQSPKWLVGYSDITVLHSHIHRHLGIETLHATMPINISDKELRHPSPAVETMRRQMFGESLEYDCPAHKLNRTGKATGLLVGGNLSMLYSLCGSESDIDTAGKILFIEDLDEYLYHIDRMMMNLKRCGHLTHLAGLVVGQMSDMHDNSIPFGRTAEEIVRDAVAEYGYPVCFNFPAGHNGTENRALKLGHSTTLMVGETVSLEQR